MGRHSTETEGSIVNVICIAGNTGQDAEIKATSNSQVMSFSVAHTHWRTKETTWFKIELWGKRGETLVSRIKKGMKVTVVGELNESRYTGKDGTERTSLVVNASEIEFADPKHSQPMGGQEAITPAATQPTAEDIDGAIPF